MNIINHLDFIIKLFILGAVPWVFLSKEDSLYFKVKGLKLPIIFNCFASLFASCIYICLYYESSNQWKDYLVFFYWAIPISVAYFIILFTSFEYVTEDGKMDTYFEIKKL